MQRQIFNSYRNVTYQFIPAEGSKELIVGFSAISKPNTFYFNYVNTLDELPVNRLYILDNFGEQGSYYLGQNRDFSIESSVISLILYVTRILDISLKNVTTLGSSKGGYSALYFALKYSLGEVIALAPQTLLGDFVKEYYPNIMEYIAGNNSKESIQFLNNLLFNLVQENKEPYPKIHLMVGSIDSHKVLHVDPFVECLSKKQINFTYDVVNGVDHSELKNYGPEYIKDYFKRKYN